MSELPLTGVSVLDLGQGLASGYCTKVLADFGAEVIKIEPPDTGDPLRRVGPFKDDKPTTDGAAFLYLCTNKKSVTLDLGTETGKGLFLQLLKDADVVVDSFKPGTMDALGLSFSALEEVRPGIILTSITFFGQTGPYASYEGSELVGLAVGGYTELTGSLDREPLQTGGNQCQYQAGLGGAIATLASLWWREESGQGQHIDVAAIEAIKAAFDGARVFSMHDSTGVIPRRIGTRNIGNEPYMPYPSTQVPCKDGHMHVHSAGSFPEAMALLTGVERLRDPELLATPRGHADEIDQLLTEWLADKEKDETWLLAQELRLPWTKVARIDEVLDNDPQHDAMSYFQKVDHPQVGQLRYPTWGMRLFGSPAVPGRAPLLGEHNQEILEGRLGQKPAAALREVRSFTGVRAKNPFPLHNVRILDLTQGIAGPVGNRLLAHLGSQVIKLEPPWGRALARGAATGSANPDAKSYNMVPNFNEVNRGGKLSVPVNLSTSEGRELMLELVRISDVVIENYSPRVMGNLGLSYEELRRVKPDIILVSMPAFGGEGPWRDFISLGPGVDAMSGMSEMTGYEDGPPLKAGNFYADQNGGFHAVCALLLALMYRRRTGQGQHLESPLRSGLISVLGEKFLEYQLTGRVPTRMGNRHSIMAPQNVYPCQGEDSWVAISIGSDGEWQALCQAMGQVDLARDDRYKDAPGRKKYEKELDTAISEWTRQRTHYEVMHILQAVGVKAGASLKSTEMIADPHFQARDSFDYTDHPDAGLFRHSGLAWKMSRAPMQLGVPAPRYAEHLDWMMNELLVLSEEESGELRDKHVVVYDPEERGARPERAAQAERR